MTVNLALTLDLLDLVNLAPLVCVRVKRLARRSHHNGARKKTDE